MIDIGTGTGLTLPYLAAAVGPAGRVAGLDRSPVMLAGARDGALDEMIRIVRPGGRLVIADVHFVNWPTPTAFNRAVTVALGPFNT